MVFIIISLIAFVISLAIKLIADPYGDTINEVLASSIIFIIIFSGVYGLSIFDNKKTIKNYDVVTKQIQQEVISCYKVNKLLEDIESVNYSIEFARKHLYDDIKITQIKEEIAELKPIKIKIEKINDEESKIIKE